MAQGHGWLWWCGLTVLGFGVGLVAGMFGVGGGFMMTPLMTVVFRIPYPIAIGTGMCQMIGVSTSALLRHLKLKQSELKLDAMLMAGSLLGVGLGAQTVAAMEKMKKISLLGHSIPAADLVLPSSYIVVLLGVAAWMGRDARRPMRPRQQPVPAGPIARLRVPPLTTLPTAEQQVSATVIAYLGLGIGFLSGLLGMGGGLILMPVMLYGIGMRVRTAAGTGILVLLATSLTGTLVHARAGHVSLGMALALLIGSTLGAQFGATLTSRMDGRILRQFFVWIVVATACAIAWDLARRVLYH